MFFPISTWLPAFAVTLAIEAPIVGLVLRPAQSFVALAVVFLFGNLATHLAIWYLGTQLLMPGSVEFTVAAESWAIAGETLLFWAALPGVTARRAFVAAGSANVASFVVGLFIFT